MSTTTVPTPSKDPDDCTDTTGPRDPLRTKVVRLSFLTGRRGPFGLDLVRTWFNVYITNSAGPEMDLEPLNQSNGTH